MDKLQLEIVTPDGLIFSGNIDSVVLPGIDGEFGVLFNHAPLVTLLNSGIIEIKHHDNKSEIVAINWGHVKVDSNKVIILAEGAVYVSGSSESEIANSLNKAKELIQSISSDSSAYTSAISKIENIARIK